jgi:glycosyltransferase involved in cell wall biosynthesis
LIVRALSELDVIEPQSAIHRNWATAGEANRGPDEPMSERSQISIGFIPAGPESLASSRLQVYLPLQRLIEEQAGSMHLLRRPARRRKRLGLFEAASIFFKVKRQRIGTVVFQKVHKGAAPLLMAALRSAGTRVVYVECDYRRSLRFSRYVHAFVAPSKRLAQDLRHRTRVETAYIPDPVEFWRHDSLSAQWQPKKRYRVMWVGHRTNWGQIEALKRELRAGEVEAFEIVTVSNHRDADVKWSLDAVRHEISRADLAIIPVGADLRSTMKSHNRATLFMASGVPVIVSESPVYENLVEDGVTGFVFRTVDDLKSLPARLAEVGLVDSVRAAALERASDYSIERVASLWRKLLGAEASDAEQVIRIDHAGGTEVGCSPGSA